MRSANGDLAPVSRMQPEFPHEAICAGADNGRVKARMTVDASGTDRRAMEVEIDFHR